MHPFSVIFIALNIFFLMVQGAPLPLDKRSYSGRGTWYHDGLGACGQTNTDGQAIAAISQSIYGTGGYCGLWVKVTNTANQKIAYGQMEDKCQSCGSGDLDMSVGLFQQIGDLNTGVLSINWDFMPQGWSP